MKVALKEGLEHPLSKALAWPSPHLGIPAVGYRHLLHLAPLCSSISVEKCRCYPVPISHREEEHRREAVARLHALAAGVDITIFQR